MAAGLTITDGAARPARCPRARRAALLALLLAVAAGHALLIAAVHRSVIGWGADELAPQRLEVAFVRALTPSRPVVRAGNARASAVDAKGAAATAANGAMQMIDSRAAGAVSASARRASRLQRRSAERADAAAASAPPHPDESHNGEPATEPHRDLAREDEEAAAPAVAKRSAAAAAPAAPTSATQDNDRALPIAGASSTADGQTGSSPTPLSTVPSAAPGPSAPLASEDGTPMPTPAASAGASADDASRAPAEIWPPSTRLSYTLTGNYRGAIGGTARVQWVRVGAHYQVQMDVTVGLPFAPLMTRRVTSDGEVTEAGLQPIQFDELTKRAFQDPSHTAIHFADDLARMSNGLVVPAPPGTQDSASQFVQLTWLFTLHPELLQPGHSITFPLALRGRVQPWTYEVLDTGSLYTVFGDVPVVHVKPRPLPGLRNVLGIEIWFAPTLQYLPARILVRENAETYIDLVLHELPLQAAAPAASAALAAPPGRPSAGPPSRRRSL